MRIGILDLEWTFKTAQINPSFRVREMAVRQRGTELSKEMHKLKSKYVILKPRKVRNKALIIYADFDKTF